MCSKSAPKTHLHLSSGDKCERSSYGEKKKKGHEISCWETLDSDALNKKPPNAHSASTAQSCPSPSQEEQRLSCFSTLLTLPYFIGAKALSNIPCHQKKRTGLNPTVTTQCLRAQSGDPSEASAPTSGRSPKSH